MGANSPLTASFSWAVSAEFEGVIFKNVDTKNYTVIKRMTGE
jgi:hypothetical protein